METVRRTGGQLPLDILRIEIQAFNIIDKEFVSLSPALTRNKKFMSADIVYAHGYEDSNIIFCTSSGEMFYYDKLNDLLTHSSESGFPFDAPAFIVNTMFTDSNKNLWIGSNDQGFKTIYNYKERFNEDNKYHQVSVCRKIRKISGF